MSNCFKVVSCDTYVAQFLSQGQIFVIPWTTDQASLGLSFPLSPPPASYFQWGWGGSSLEFLSPFVLQTAGGVFRLVSFSLALPQFKKISLRLLSGPSGRSLP